MVIWPCNIDFRGLLGTAELNDKSVELWGDVDQRVLTKGCPINLYEFNRIATPASVDGVEKNLTTWNFRNPGEVQNQGLGRVARPRGF